MTKRKLVRVTSFIIAAVVVFLCFVATMHSEIRYLKRVNSNHYSMSLFELDGSLVNISSALKKAVYSSDAAQFSTLTAEIVTESNTAKNALSQLPSSLGGFEKVSKLLSQSGDYSLYLSKKLILGGDLTTDERKTLNRLAESAQNISKQIEAIRIQYDSNDRWSAEIENLLEGATDTALITELAGIEELLADYPTLVYDGPFADNVLNGEIKMLKGQQVLTVEEAKRKAAVAVGITAELLEDGGEITGNMPSYSFVCDEMTVNVTKSGGFISFMRKHRSIGDEKVDYEKAVEIAKKYLDGNSGRSFKSTYYFTEEGVCTVNLVEVIDGVLCYPDLIKVGVALDNGEVVSVDAETYLSNHTERTFGSHKQTPEKARERVSELLSVISHQDVLIPLNSGKEVRCFEFLCKGIDGEEVLVYINSDTLNEEQILILLKTDGGTLTK